MIKPMLIAGALVTVHGIVRCEDSAAEQAELPILLTPSRLRQATADAPASTTVIHGDFLRRYGVRSVVEAMRFVPGMQITMADGNQYQVNYHGTDALNPRRLNVMVDNVAMYQATIAEVRWDTLPVSMDDVDRIEVVRGPASATYGPNSMMAVVNVITRHPADSTGMHLSVDSGGNRTRRLTIRYGARLSETDFRVSAESSSSGGFDRSSGTASSPSFSSDLSANRFSLAAVSKMGLSTTLRSDLAISQSTRGFSRVEANETSPAPVNNHSGYVNLKFDHDPSIDHSISLRGYFSINRQTQGWRTAYPVAALLPEMFALYQVSPAYAAAVLSGKVPSGGSTEADALAAAALQKLAALGPLARQLVQTSANQNYEERRGELELQDTRVVSSRLRSVAAVGVRGMHGHSQTYFDGAVDNDVLWASGNLEYKPTERYTVNVGSYIETSRLSDVAFAPRLSLSYRLEPNQSLRFVASQGVRSPDIHEQASHWTYAAYEASPAQYNGSKLYQAGISTRHLSNERVRSFEVGYLANVPDRGTSFGARIFYEHLDHLISERLSIGSFNPSNDGHVDLAGGEFQLATDLSSTWSAFFNYAFLNNNGSAASVEKTQYARQSGAFGVSHSSDGHVRFSADYLYQGSRLMYVGHFGRLDLNFDERLVLGGRRVEMRASVQRLDNTKNVWIRNGSPIFYRYPNRYRALVGLSMAF